MGVSCLELVFGLLAGIKALSFNMGTLPTNPLGYLLLLAKNS
jgi:hypothetical protein